MSLECTNLPEDLDKYPAAIDSPIPAPIECTCEIPDWDLEGCEGHEIGSGTEFEVVLINEIPTMVVKPEKPQPFQPFDNDRIRIQLFKRYAKFIFEDLVASIKEAKEQPGTVETRIWIGIYESICNKINQAFPYFVDMDRTWRFIYLTRYEALALDRYAKNSQLSINKINQASVNWIMVNRALAPYV